MQKTALEYVVEIEGYKIRIDKGLDMTAGLIDEYANAEVAYKRAYAVAEATLKSGGMTAGMAKTQAFDDDDVCEAYHKQMVAEWSLKAHRDKLNHITSCMNATQSQNRHLTGH